MPQTLIFRKFGACVTQTLLCLRAGGTSRAGAQDEQAHKTISQRNNLSCPFICAFIVVDIIQKPKYLEKKNEMLENVDHSSSKYKLR